MRERLARFMAGRNGNDQLNNFLLAIDVVLIIAALICSKTVAGLILNPIAIALLVYVYIRMFSKNIYKRRDENNKYLRFKFKVATALKVRKEQWVQRKDYKFFTCPSCHSTLRVPKGKGKVKIVCRRCGTSFFGKT